jgi:hypothetical protein
VSESLLNLQTFSLRRSRDTGQFVIVVIVRLDKKNTREAIAAAESEKGKKLERAEEK